MHKVALLLLIAVALSAVAVHAQDYDNTTWVRLFPASSPFRKQHMTAFLDTSMGTFGGLDNALFSPTEYNSYTFDAGTWTESASTADVGRRAAGWVQYGTQIVAFGGFNGGSRTSSTLFFETTTRTATVRAGDSGDWTLSNPASVLVHTAAPCTDPTAAIDGDDLFLFGGLTSITMLNSVTRINLANSTVFGVDDDEGSRPTRRFATAGAVIEYGGAKYFYLFGGLRQKTPAETAETMGDEATFRISDSQWPSASSVFGGGRTLPPARAYAAMINLPDNAGLVLYGGSVHTGTSTVTVLDDTWVLDLGGAGMTPGQWAELTPGGTKPPARSQSAVMFASFNGELAMLVHGGNSASGGTLNDVWKLVLNPCPFGENNCFTPDPFRNTTTTTTVSSTTGVVSPAGGGAGGEEEGTVGLSTGLVSIGAADSVAAAFAPVYAALF